MTAGTNPGLPTAGPTLVTRITFRWVSFLEVLPKTEGRGGKGGAAFTAVLAITWSLLQGLLALTSRDLSLLINHHLDQHFFDFINDFNRQFKIQLEPIYTGKMLFGIFDVIEKDFFKKGYIALAKEIEASDLFENALLKRSAGPSVHLHESIVNEVSEKLLS